MSGNEFSQIVHIITESVVLEGDLDVSQSAHAVVIFAHGSGSSRYSKRNKYVAQVLREAGMGTLLFDLLTRDEDVIYENRFDIPLLAKRLSSVTQWIKKQPQTRNLKIGYFGASTGAAAALVAAAEPNSDVEAIVSRGGRPDLAEKYLHLVTAPTLLIVGGNDYIVIQLNQQAYNFLGAKKELRIVPGASHLFEEPGTLEQVARLATDWFNNHLLSKRE